MQKTNVAKFDFNCFYGSDVHNITSDYFLFVFFTTYFLNLLKYNEPDEAFAIICITNLEIYW